MPGIQLVPAACTAVKCVPGLTLAAPRGGWSSCTTHVLVSEPTPPKASSNVHQWSTSAARSGAMHVQSNIEPDCSARVLQAPGPSSRFGKSQTSSRLAPSIDSTSSSPICSTFRSCWSVCHVLHGTESRSKTPISQELDFDRAQHHSISRLYGAIAKSPTLHIDARLPPRTLASYSSNSSTCSLSKRAKYSATIKSAMPCPTASWSKQTYLQPSTPSASP